MVIINMSLLLVPQPNRHVMYLSNPLELVVAIELLLGGFVLVPLCLGYQALALATADVTKMVSKYVATPTHTLK